MAPRRFSMRVSDVRNLYESEILIDTFNRGFAGRWHTPVFPDIPGIADSDHYVCHLGRIGSAHRVLDFGSGVGVTTCGIARIANCRVQGLNISRKQINLAARHAGEAGFGTRVTFDCYRGRRFPYRARSFDRVVFFESTCHVPHKPLLFAEMFRVLRPGGACAGQEWMLASETIGDRDYEDYIRPIETACEASLRGLEAYRTLMEEAGFVRVRVIDARDIAPEFARSFADPSPEPIRVTRGDDVAVRLSQGNVALSNAFHRGLFTVGFVYGEKPLQPDRRRPAPRRLHRGPNPLVASSPTRLVPGTEYTPEMFAPEKNAAWLEFHRTTFAVPTSEPLAAFAHLTERAQACTLEASCKVESGKLNAARFNLFYHGPYREHFLDKVFKFFDDVHAKQLHLDRRPVDRFLSRRIDLSGVRKVVTGLDIRDERARSRLKLWFILSGAPELERRAIALHGPTREIRTLHRHRELLVGFDLRFDGATSIKIYPDVTAEDLRVAEYRRRLATVLSDASLDAMARCSWTHIYLARHNPDIVLQFHPTDPDEFVDRYLPGADASRIHRIYAGGGLLDMVVAIPDGELERRAVANFALYYMPAPPLPYCGDSRHVVATGAHDGRDFPLAAACGFPRAK